MELPLIDDYLQLFLNDTPMIDVRAPVEFEQGAFPHTRNLPLMNDDERHRVGIRYKEAGQDKAIELGHQLVSGDIMQQRIDAWSEFVKQHPQGALYCFRGGLRSRTSQQWIYEQTGVMYPRVKGGYKAMRRFLINALQDSMKQIQPIVLTGRTGTGKTLLLAELHDMVDLEDIFKHRGSAFGRRVTPQPSQIDIENQLAISLLKLIHQGRKQVVMEDEARNIGSRKMPEDINHALASAPLMVLERNVDERVDIVFKEYIHNALAEYQQQLGKAAGFTAWSDNLLGSLDRIQKRLGGVRHKEIRALMNNAIVQHREHNETLPHKAWIHALLTEYYDPMYDYQLSRKADRVVFRGSQQAILDYLKTRDIS